MKARSGRLHLHHAGEIAPERLRRIERGVETARPELGHYRLHLIGPVGVAEEEGDLPLHARLDVEVRGERRADISVQFRRSAERGTGDHGLRRENSSRPAKKFPPARRMASDIAVAGKERASARIVDAVGIGGDERLQPLVPLARHEGCGPAAIVAEHPFRIAVDAEFAGGRTPIADRQPHELGRLRPVNRMRGLDFEFVLRREEARIAQAVTRFEQDGLAPRQGGIRCENGPARHVAHEDRLARTVDDRVVGPGRQLIVARIAAPAKGRAFGGNMEAETFVGDDVDPRMRRRFASAQPDRIFTAILGKAAEAVPEVQIAAFELNRHTLVGRRKHRQQQLGALLLNFGRLGIERCGPGDLIRDRAVAGMEDGPRGGDERRPGLRLHQIPAHCKNMLTRAIRKAAKPQILAHGVERMLKVLSIGRGALVDDHEIGGDAAGSEIFLRPQGLARDAEITVVVDPEAEDREIAGDCQRPQRRLRRKTGPYGRSVGAKMHIRIDKIAAEHLELKLAASCEVIPTWRI
ncbi:hypothetical protein ACVI1N_002723 [Sinorhizobium medicae]